MKSFFIGKYEIKLPIIRGRMDVGVSLSSLVSTVVNEEGIGIFPSAVFEILNKEMLGDSFRNSIYRPKEELCKAYEKSKRFIGVNNIMAALYSYTEKVYSFMAEKVDIRSLGDRTYLSQKMRSIKEAVSLLKAEYNLCE